MAEMVALLLDAQMSTMAVKVENTSMLAENNALKAEVDRLRDWSAQQSRYKLTSIWGEGPAVAYSLKESQANGEPPHLLCPNCFAQTKKSFLAPYEHKSNKDGRQSGLACQCGCTVAYPWSGSPPTPQFAPD